MPAKNVLQKVPTCSQVIHKQKNEISHYSWENAGMSALVLYNVQPSDSCLPETSSFQSRLGVLHQAGLLRQPGNF